jgi:hypothetical protein
MIDGLSKALNTTFEPEVKDLRPVDLEMKQVAIKANDIKSKRIFLEEQGIIKEELLELINSLQTVRRALETEMVKPPSRASDVEAFASLSAQIKETLRELRILSESKASLELKQISMENNFDIKSGNFTQNIQNNVFNISSKELDAMLEKAEKDRKIDAITVDFEVDDQIK